MSVPEPRTFDEWVRWIFDHPVADYEWYWDENEWPEGNNTWPYRGWEALPEAAAVLSHMVRLFENPAQLVDQYSLAQLGQGLWFLASGAWRQMTIITDTDFPLADRQRCIRSFESLYRLLFSRHCDDAMSSERTPGNPLNSPCYMWWDLLPWGELRRLRNEHELGHRPFSDEEMKAFYVDEAELARQRPIHLTMLETMQSILRIDHLACREGALHGLGHLHEFYPEEVMQIIEQFLRSEPSLDAGIRRYAENAGRGAIL